MALTAREKRAAKRATYFGSDAWGVKRGPHLLL